MAAGKIKKGKIKYIIIPALIIAVIIVSACLSDAQWESIYRKAGLLSETDGCVMSVHFIDVGQGDCTVIKLEGGQSIIIDSGEAVHAPYIKRYLKSENIRRFDLCVVTHPHSDHYGGMAQILEDYPADKTILPKIPSKLLPDDNYYLDFISACNKYSDEVDFASAGQKIKIGGAEITVLGPVGSYDDLNDMSIVLKVSVGDASFIITGDCSKDEEKDIISRFGEQEIKCSVLRLAHHGSDDSTGDEWLNAADPDAAVISVGKNNRYSHPSASTLAKLDSKGIRYYRTDICGDIIMKVTDDNIEIIY